VYSRGRSWDAAIWKSSDACTWTRVGDADEALGGEGKQSIGWIRQLSDGTLLALGPEPQPRGSCCSPPGVARWASADGSSWHQLPADPAEPYWRPTKGMLGERYTATNDEATVRLYGPVFGSNYSYVDAIIPPGRTPPPSP
jgi:hypothetical protein